MCYFYRGTDQSWHWRRCGWKFAYVHKSDCLVKSYFQGKNRAAHLFQLDLKICICSFATNKFNKFFLHLSRTVEYEQYSDVGSRTTTTNRQLSRQKCSVVWMEFLCYRQLSKTLYTDKKKTELPYTCINQELFLRPNFVFLYNRRKPSWTKLHHAMYFLPRRPEQEIHDPQFRLHEARPHKKLTN